MSGLMQLVAFGAQDRILLDSNASPCKLFKIKQCNNVKSLKYLCIKGLRQRDITYILIYCRSLFPDLCLKYDLERKMKMRYVHRDIIASPKVQLRNKISNKKAKSREKRLIRQKWKHNSAHFQAP